MLSRFLARHVWTLAAAAWLAVAANVPLADAEPLAEKFYGSYVGMGTAQYLADGTTEQRDLDVTIEPYKSNGFTVKWITVMRDPASGRVGEEVKRRAVEEDFLPLEGRENIYILAPEGGLFSRAELPNPLRGEPMRWATVENGEITVYSIAIDDNGHAETQVYRRKLTDTGMEVSFLRLQDENVVVRVTGTLTRAE